MTNTSLTGSVTKVAIGNLQIDGLLGSDGKFYVAVPQTAELFLVRQNQASRGFKALLGEGFQFAKMRTELNSKAVNAITLPDFERLVAKLDRSGNKAAQDFRDTLAGLSLQQLFCDAFDIKFEAADRQTWLQTRQESKELCRELTDQIQRWIRSRECSQPEWMYYASAFDLLNVKLFGMKAKQIREELGIPNGSLNRDHFGKRSLLNINMLQSSAARLMAKNPEMRPTEAITLKAEALSLDPQSFKI